MSPTIVLIEYGLSEAQQKLPFDVWQERAKQIAAIKGLTWKYWLEKPDSNERGGVYLFETLDDAEQAAQMLVGSLNSAGVKDVRHRIFDVDPQLSALTRGQF